MNHPAPHKSDASLPEARARAAAPVHRTDVVIVGGGLSGSLAAVVLGRAGYRVTLVDRHAVHPPEFRVEKIAGDQVELFRRLGLLEAIAAAATPFDRLINVHRGRVIDHSRNQHYGILYQDLVRVVRAELPASVDFMVRKVIDVEAGRDRQRVTLEGGDAIEARLIVLATGMGDALRHKLGIRRRVIVEKQSLSFGFNIRPGIGEAFDFPALTYYGERVADRIDYLSLFPVGEIMRANLFTFRDHRDPWNRDLRREPKATLLGTLPGLKRFLGDFDVVDPVQNWLMDLTVVEGHRCDGVVLIGDAFQTNCPAAGTGVSRLLVDVQQLCTVHIPRWLASPGMGAAKVSDFYDDPVKQAADTRSAELAEYRRTLTIDTRLKWRLRRGMLRLGRRGIAWIDRLDPRWSAGLRGLRSAVPGSGKLLSRR